MEQSASVQRALLIVDHGTRDETALLVLAQLASAVAAARPEWLVEHAHMELAEPDFDTGIDALVHRGAARIDVHLHFLGSGYHVRETIPELISMARVRHPSVRIEAGEPLGHHPGILDLILDRLDAQARPERQSSKE